jgi:hypothetical protein
MSVNIQADVSLIPFSSPVIVQGSQASCGPCATYNALQIIGNLDGHPFASNPQVQYNQNLVVQGQQYAPALGLGIDGGVYPDQMMSLLTTLGVTQNTALAYGMDSISTMPSAADYADAATHTVSDYTTINLMPVRGSPTIGEIPENLLVQEIAAQIIQGKPLLMAFTEQQGFHDEETIPLLANQTGINDGAVISGHMVVVDEINTSINMLDVESWGPSVGDVGHFKLSLDSFYAQYQGNGPVETQIQGIYAINGFNGVNLHQTAATATVASCYVAILGRAPELGGMTAWTGAANAGVSLPTMCDGFLGSPESASIGLGPGATNAAFIDALYVSILNRHVDPSGLGAYSNQLAVGMSRGTVASELISAIVDAADWSGNTFTRNTGNVAADTLLMNESLLFRNKIQVGEDIAITMQVGDHYGSVLHNILATITTDQASILTSLVGVPDQIGHSATAVPIL